MSPPHSCSRRFTHCTFLHTEHNHLTPFLVTEAEVRPQGALPPFLRQEVSAPAGGGRGYHVHAVLVPARPPVPRAPPRRGRGAWPRLLRGCCARLQRLLHVAARLAANSLSTGAVIGGNESSNKTELKTAWLHIMFGSCSFDSWSAQCHAGSGVLLDGGVDGGRDEPRQIHNLRPPP